MAATHHGSAQPTEKQLKQSLKNTKYLHPGPAAKQIMGGLEEFADLKPSVKEYTLDDGKRVDLMQLSGIIPIKILEKQHNVPVRVWFPRAFPREKPIIFINAGQDLALATLDYVDSQGKVNLPYLRDWKESRSDISTLLKMLKFKFGQHCPVHPIRGKRFSLDVPHSTNSNNPSPIAPRKFESSPVPPPVRPTSVQEQEVTELRKEIESKDYELASYKKTITTMSTETDELRSRVRDLEQEKHESQIFSAAQEREERAVSGAYEEVMVELERRKVEGEKLKQQLQEEAEKLAREMKEKEKIRSRLDAKVSDLTQTREKIAILEVEKEDYQQRLQRALRDLKYYKAEIRELMHTKRALNAKVTTLEDLIRSLQEGSESSESDDETSEGELEITDASEATEESEMVSDVVALGREKLESTELSLADGLAEMKQSAEELKGSTELISESKTFPSQIRSSGDKSVKQISKDDKLNQSELADVQTQTQTKHAEKEVQVCILSSHEEKAVEFAEREIQVDFAISCKDVEVQVDTLLVKYTRYKQFAEEKSVEVKRLKEELTGIHDTHQSALKESEAKIHQLLSIKARLTAKNTELNKKVDELSSANIQSSLSSALQTISDLQKDLVGNVEEEPERLKNTLAEMEEMKKTHKAEIQAIIQKVAKANLKVKEEEVKLTNEIKDLKAKLESTQQQLKAASNASALQWGNNMEGGRDRMPENCLISFMEVESDALCTLDGGTWGDLSSEVTFRGKRMTAFCVPKESLAQFPVHVIHKQVSTMSQLRHPNLVLFIAIAMDAPGGLMILTELTTCTLRQAYQSRLLGMSKLPVLLDVAYALNFLHLQKRPIVHNNLSSLCVVVEEGGGREGEWRAKLSDLGSTTSLMTLSENKERELVYFAPEIVEGTVDKLSAGTAVDIYSYGILMCELSTCSLPRSSAAISESVGNLKPSLPQISCLIQCCVAANPDQRPHMGSMLRKVKHLVVNKIHVP